MKIKSFIRGMGCGIIIASLVILLTLYKDGYFKNDSKKNSDGKKVKTENTTCSSNDVIKETKEEINKDTEKKEETTAKDNKEVTKKEETTKEETTKEETTEQETTIQETTESGDKVTIEISKGTSSDDAAKVLKEAGLIDDEKAFDDFMKENNYESKLKIGSYSIEKGADFEQIAQKIMGN